MILTKLRTDAGVVVGRSKALIDACDRLAELKQQVTVTLTRAHTIFDTRPYHYLTGLCELLTLAPVGLFDWALLPFDSPYDPGRPPLL